jgi:hypothetical protein
MAEIKRKVSIRTITLASQEEEFTALIKYALAAIKQHDAAKTARDERGMMLSFDNFSNIMNELVTAFNDCPVALKPTGKLARALGLVNIIYTNLHAGYAKKYKRDSPETPRSFKYDNPFDEPVRDSI